MLVIDCLLLKTTNYEGNVFKFLPLYTFSNVWSPELYFEFSSQKTQFRQYIAEIPTKNSWRRKYFSKSWESVSFSQVEDKKTHADN